MNIELRKRAEEYLEGAHYQPAHPIIRDLLAEIERLGNIEEDRP